VHKYGKSTKHKCEGAAGQGDEDDGRCNGGQDIADEVVQGPSGPLLKGA